MGRHPTLGAGKAYERLKQAFKRYSEVCTALGELAEPFENTPDLQGEAFGKPAQMMAMLPDALLVRALAEEGLALVEQISWDAYLIEEDNQIAKLPDRAELLKSLQTIKSEVEPRKRLFELTKQQMDNIVEVTLTAANALGKLGKSLGQLIETADPQKDQKIREAIQTLLHETEGK